MGKYLGILLILIFSISKAGTYGPFSAATISNLAFSGSSTSWSNLSNATALDNNESNINSLSGNGDYSDYLLATNFNFSIPTGQSVTGVFVEVNRRTTNAPKTKDKAVYLYKNGLTGTDQATNSAWPSSATYDSYGGAADLMGATLTPSEVNAPTFGVAISVRKSSGSGSMTAYIDHVRITVYTTDLLPVDLISFNANKIGNAVQLSWSTASEVNNDFFNLQKSTDGLNFSTIAKLAGNGSKASISEYSYLDESTMGDVNYYRITQVDFDGQATQYNIIAVKNAKTFGSSENIVFPNPSNGIISLDISKLRGANIQSIEVFDMAGNKINSIDGNSFTNLNISTIPGIYFLLISTTESSYSSRLVVE